MTTEKAYDIVSLAKHWRCHRDTIYELIRNGKLRAFKVGPAGLRVTAEEARRWEKESAEQNAIPQGNARSGGVKVKPLRSSQIRALVNAKG